ncbi:MAG: transcription-repair coupling factor, partial [Treponema sp.]|nr:transcription-repair coupling factor [Treponema sp.]
MNTLSFPELLRIAGKSAPVSALSAAFASGKFPLEIAGCEGAFASLLLAKLYAAKPGRYFAVVPQENDAADFAADLSALGLPCGEFPWWGAAPYRELSPFSAVFGERAKMLSDLALGKPGIVVIPQRAFLTPLPPPDYIKSLLVPVKPKGKIDTAALARTLTAYGYTRVPQVQMQGEFALRGEVLDIYMGGNCAEFGGAETSGTAVAYRILFDFDQVESIKCFDPLMQGSGPGREKLSELAICPMREVVWTDERIEALAENLAACKEFSDGGKGIIEELISRRTIPGEEMLYPLAFNKGGVGNGEWGVGNTGNLLDYLGTTGTLVLIDRERLENAQESLNREYHSLYLRSQKELHGPKPSQYPLPERLLLNFSELMDCRGKQSPLISFKNIKTEPKPDVHHFDVRCESARSFFGNINYLKEEFASLHESGWHIIVAAESEVQAERIRSILVPHKLLSIMASSLSAGFSLPELKFMLVQENEIFGRRKRPPRSLKTARSSPIDTFVELNPGDYVVHVNHGIGLFKGIERINALGYERD